jgi:hypothetical protein
VLDDQSCVLCCWPLLYSTLLQSVGTIKFTVQFMPFEEPQFDDDIELKPVQSGADAGFWVFG